MNKMLRLSVFAVLVHCVLLGAAVAETKDDDAYTALRTELVEDVAHSIRRTHAETCVEKLSNGCCKPSEMFREMHSSRPNCGPMPISTSRSRSATIKTSLNRPSSP